MCGAYLKGMHRALYVNFAISLSPNGAQFHMVYLLGLAYDQASFIRISCNGGGSGGGASARWVGLKLWTPPSYNSKGFLGWAPATPSFFGHRSPVWLVAGAPFRFVVVQAPCQKGKKKCFHPMCLYSIYSEFSGEFKNAQKGAFFQPSQNNYLIPDRVLVKDVQYPSWWNTDAQLQDLGFNSSGWHKPVIAQKRWSCSPLFSPWLIMKLICKGRVM